MDELQNELKVLIIDSLALEDIEQARHVRVLFPQLLDDPCHLEPLCASLCKGQPSGEARQQN